MRCSPFKKQKTNHHLTHHHHNKYTSTFHKTKKNENAENTIRKRESPSHALTCIKKQKKAKALTKISQTNQKSFVLLFSFVKFKVPFPFQTQKNGIECRSKTGIHLYKKYHEKVDGKQKEFELGWELLLLHSDASEEELLDTVSDDVSIGLQMTLNGNAADPQQKLAARKKLLKRALKRNGAYTLKELFFHTNGTDKLVSFLNTKTKSANVEVKTIASTLVQLHDVINHHFISKIGDTTKGNAMAKQDAQARRAKFVLYHVAKQMRKYCRRQLKMNDVYHKAWKEAVEPFLNPALASALGKSVADIGPKLHCQPCNQPSVKKVEILGGSSNGEADAAAVSCFQQKMLEIAKKHRGDNPKEKRPFDHATHWAELASEAKRTKKQKEWALAKTVCANCLYGKGEIRIHSLRDCQEAGRSM